MGISLNHGIVLLYRVRRNEAAGLAPEAAVKEAVHVGFRPIMLTTLATRCSACFLRRSAGARARRRNRGLRWSF